MWHSQMRACAEATTGKLLETGSYSLSKTCQYDQFHVLLDHPSITTILVPLVHLESSAFGIQPATRHPKVAPRLLSIRSINCSSLAAQSQCPDSDHNHGISAGYSYILSVQDTHRVSAAPVLRRAPYPCAADDYPLSEPILHQCAEAVADAVACSKG